jgi:hypothetical protein
MGKHMSVLLKYLRLAVLFQIQSVHELLATC